MTGTAPNWRAANYPRLASAISILGGSLVLAGWAFDIPRLRQPLASGASMRANTAVAFVLAGLSLHFLVARRFSVSLIYGAGVALIGLLTLSQHLLGWNLGIDQILFLDHPLAGATSAPGRMAPAVAFSMAALGLALVASAGQARAWIRQSPLLLTALIAAVSCTGFIFDVRSLDALGPYTTMPIQSAVLLYVMSVGVLFAQPPVGVMAPLMSTHIEGQVARRLIPAGILIPLGLGWLWLLGHRAGLYNTEFGLMLMVASMMVVSSIVTWVNARLLGNADVQRRQAVEALRQANETLEQRVAAQTLELSRSEAQLRLVIDNAHDAFVASDQPGRIIEWNPQAERTFGWRRAEALGHLVRDLIIPERHRRTYDKGVARFIATGDGPIVTERLELKTMHRDGHELNVELTISPVRVDGTWRFNAFARDLTATKAAGDRLRSSLAEKEVLLREIHHRVKNNMQVVSSLLNLQADATQDPRLRASLTESQSRVRAMALVHETVYQSDNLAGVNFATFANTLWTYLTRTFGKAGGEILFRGEATAPPLDIDQAVPCALILTELLSNALKYAFAGGRSGSVSVSLCPVPGEPGLFQLRVSDDGVGFTDALRAAAVARGSIGLNIITALGQQLGATLTWSGPGTIFTMTFALHRRTGGQESAA